MRNSAEYMRAYRLKNRDKIRAYERLRNAKRTAKNGPSKVLETTKEEITRNPVPFVVKTVEVVLSENAACFHCGKPAYRKGYHNGAIVSVCKDHL